MLAHRPVEVHGPYDAAATDASRYVRHQECRVTQVELEVQGIGAAGTDDKRCRELYIDSGGLRAGSTGRLLHLDLGRRNGRGGCGGETGFRVSTEDVKAWADTLETLARDPALRTTIGEAGRRLYETRFSVPAMAAGAEAFYRSLTP